MTAIPEGYMEDAQGRLVPDEMVNEIDKLRHQTVMSIVESAKGESERLAKFKTGVMEDIQTFMDLSAERFDVKLGGQKGNVSLVSFDGRFKIIRAINENMVFDERLQVARELIDDCIKEWGQDARPEIMVLINSAFDVDKQGNINTGRILGLPRHKIDHPKWQKAMQAISESLQVAGSKTYVRVYERKNDGSYKQINLDVSAL